MRGLHGPLIEQSDFPKLERWTSDEPAVMNEKVIERRLLRSSNRLKWLTAFGSLLFCALASLIITIVVRGRVSPATDFLERSVANKGLFAYGNSYTFSSPSILPGRFEEWTEDDFQREFELFRLRYGRTYTSSSVDLHRKKYQAFKSNLIYIHSHNRDASRRYTLAPNEFTDYTRDEWLKRFQSLPSGEFWTERQGKHATMWTLPLVANASLPEEVNWLDKGCVTPVKDQSKCGSCWAFSSTGAIEGNICSQTGVLLSLSEQQLVDCAGPEGTHGCEGGFMDNAFQYVMDNAGLCGEDEYPYTAETGQCRKDCRRVVKVDAIMDVPPSDAKALKAALAFHGPVAAAIEADKPNFQFYHSGVFDLDCGHNLNHAILVVGYGVDKETREQYWIVKNSWGANWGDHGYVKLGTKHHGKAGECGILLSPTIPIVSAKDLLVKNV